MSIASKITYFPAAVAGDGDLDIENGSSIVVYCISCSNEDDSAETTVRFKTKRQGSQGAAGTVFHTIEIGTNDTEDLICAFIADSGIVANVINGTANITVMHSQAGA